MDILAIIAKDVGAETPRAVRTVLEERLRQERKWGESNHDPFCFLTVLVEEVGELSRAALHARFGGPDANNMEAEAVQVAAVALSLVECLMRGKWHWGRHDKTETPTDTACVAEAGNDGR